MRHLAVAVDVVLSEGAPQPVGVPQHAGTQLVADLPDCGVVRIQQRALTSTRVWCGARGVHARRAWDPPWRARQHEFLGGSEHGLDRLHRDLAAALRLAEQLRCVPIAHHNI